MEQFKLFFHKNADVGTDNTKVGERKIQGLDFLFTGFLVLHYIVFVMRRFVLRREKQVNIIITICRQWQYKQPERD